MPAAGWYDDPQGTARQRYWDGVRWTDALRDPPAAPVDAPPPDPADLREADGDARSRHPVLIGAGLVAVALVATAGLLLTGTAGSSGGAPDARTAAEELIAALDRGDLTGAVELLAPDEVALVEPVLAAGDLPQGARLDGAAELGDVVFDLRVAAPRELSDDLHLVPIDGVVRGDGGALGRVAPGPADEPWTFDLAAMDVTFGFAVSHLVAVERDGSWYVSLLGSALEVFGSADPAPAPRAGASDAGDAVEQLVTAAAGPRPLRDGLELIDPQDLQVLDHYRSLIGLLPAYEPGLRAFVGTDGSGDLLTVRNLTLTHETEPGRVDVDLEGYCLTREFGGAPDTLCLDERDDFLPAWSQGVRRALVEPARLPVQVATVERDGQHYVSLRGTVTSTLAPAIARFDAATLAGAFELGTEHPRVAAPSIGEAASVPLTDGWVLLEVPGGGALCPPDAGIERRSWEVEGTPVTTRSFADDPTFPGFGRGDDAAGSERPRLQAVGLRGPGPYPAELTVRTAESTSGC